MAGAAVAVFSWTLVEKRCWEARALWYCSLSFSIGAIATSSQQGKLLNICLQSSTHRTLRREYWLYSRGRPAPLYSRYQNIAQCCDDAVLMSYAWANLLIALTLYVWVMNSKWAFSPPTELVVYHWRIFQPRQVSFILKLAGPLSSILLYALGTLWSPKYKIHQSFSG